jgi:Protein of unknown function (DUF3140)
MTEDEQRDLLMEFTRVVNMTAAQLDKWLETPESKTVGYKASASGESVGHQSGRHIIDMLKKKQPAFDDADVQHARKVVGYIHRHLAQRPAGDINATHWRYSLMNWGHDPALNRRIS